METSTLNETQLLFAKEIDEGLSSEQKFLPSKYFYDGIGDRLFQKIMAMGEYYLTNSEFEILSMKKQQLAELFSESGKPFQLIEFGAGDGMKTKILLAHLLEQGIDFTYMPIDISANVLEILSKDLRNELPQLKVSAINNDYFKALDLLGKDRTPKVILFMGANIGNFKQEQASFFLAEIARRTNSGDLLMIGFDLKKDPDIILKAYNDSQGITRAFNFNLLERINKELGGEFNLDRFKHYPTYDPVSGMTKSYLISLAKQEVKIAATGKHYAFAYAEPIQMELSKKYGITEIEQLAERTGFVVKEHLLDCKGYFVDSVWKVQ